MDALPLTTAAPVAVPLAPSLTRRMENYARCVAAGMSYAEAFRQGGCVASTAGSMSRQIQEMNRLPKVRARIAELKSRADEEIVSTMNERMAWLRLVITADPAELTRIVSDPCGSCWNDDLLAAAYAAHFAAVPFGEEREALPDSNKPRRDCTSCGGSGHSRVICTPTDELSPAARALFKGASQDEKGVIKIQTHDQAVAMDMLNKMQSAYVTRSLNLNANVSVHAARDATPEDTQRLLAAFAPSE